MIIQGENHVNTHDKGKESEDMAARFLEHAGYKIVKRNFIFGKTGEIDIIAKDGDYLVFVEVRSASAGSPIDPLETITYVKQRKIRSVAQGYLYVNNLNDVPCRFDVVTLSFKDGNRIINHLKNAF